MTAELRFPAMVVLLSRRIKILQDLSDGDGVGVPLGEVAASGFCLLFFASFGPGALFVGVGVASGFGGPPIPGGEGMRVLFCSRAKGMDLMRSPRSCFFRAGGFGVGGGTPVRLSFPVGNESASSSSGWPGLWWLEDLTPLRSFSLVRLSILVQRLKSILDGAPGWWVMRLNQGMGSSGGGTGVLDIACAASAQQVGAVDLSVISFFFGVLFYLEHNNYCAPV